MNRIWFWLSIVEFLLIVYLGYKLSIKTRKAESSNSTFAQLEKARKTKIDMEGIMNSINKSKDLYKELSASCHPDRFINSPKQKLAEEIFQEISKNRRNFEELSKLKERAMKELELHFA